MLTSLAYHALRPRIHTQENAACSLPYLETETDRAENLQRFIDWAKQLIEIKELELTLELIQEFIDRIVLCAPKHLDGKRHQVMDIHYSSVSILWELSPEEMEEAFQKDFVE